MQVSPPLVAFRETVFSAAEAPDGIVGNTPRGARVVEAATPSGACVVRVRALPLPGELLVGPLCGKTAGRGPALTITE